jgi:hypothetical protein
MPACAQGAGVDYVEPSRPYASSAAFKAAKPAPVPDQGALLVPLITWAADGVTVSSHGGLDENPNSALTRAMGRPAKLEVIDDFNKQVAHYVTGKSPFLRGTDGMIALVAGALKEKAPGLEPVVFLQLSSSTGADGVVGKDIDRITDLKGKTLVMQINGPHLSLVGNMLKDAGLKATDVAIKFVPEITAPPKWAKTQAALDPANALRRDANLSGAACIYPDIMALTAGGTIGSGLEGTVKGARPLFTTKTANNVIFDVYAVRKDFLEKHPEVVDGFRKAHLAEQEKFLGELANVAKKKEADRKKLDAFKKVCEPLSAIFLQDAAAVNDYIVWLGIDSALAGSAGNLKFFDPQNPVGFVANTRRVQEFFTELGLIESPVTVVFRPPGDMPAGLAAPARKEKQTFADTQAVRRAAESSKANVLYRYTFKFPAQVSEIDWRDYKPVFESIHENVSRYGGAVVQLRGHADNFFYNFVRAKRDKGEEFYERRNKETGKFDKLPLPKSEELLNDANSLSYSRAFAVKQAYAAYVREALHLSPAEVDLSRFDVKGMGIGDPIIKNPASPEERASNMRGEMFIIAVESELPSDFGADDLR